MVGHDFPLRSVRLGYFAPSLGSTLMPKRRKPAAKQRAPIEHVSKQVRAAIESQIEPSESPTLTEILRTKKTGKEFEEEPAAK